MKKLFKPGLFVLSAVLVFGGCTSPKDKKEWTFDFQQDNEGFEPIFADYSDDGNNLTTYEMAFGRALTPITADQTQGLFIQAQNRSDDLFMGFSKQLTGLKGNQTYTIKVTFKLYTDAESGSIGVGGSPAESVYVKAGAVNEKPELELDDQDTYRLTIDKGNQSEGSLSIPVVSNMAKPEGSPEGYAVKDLSVTIDLKTAADGSVYLVIGTDSGFEGFTRYFLDDVVVTATQK